VNGRRIRWRRWLLLGVAAVALVVYMLWQRTLARPVWWNPPDPSDPLVQEVAERVEYQLVEQAQLVRPADESWGVRVQESQVNAWLAGRLPKWLAHHDRREWSETVRLVQVRFEDGAAIIGAEVDHGLQKRVLSIRIVPALEDGRLTFVADAVSVGALSIGTAPIDRAMEELEHVMDRAVLDDPGVQQVVETLRGERSWPATFELADGRWVEVLEFTIERGAVRASCKTLPRRNMPGREGAE